MITQIVGIGNNITMHIYFSEFKKKIVYDFKNIMRMTI